MNEYIRPFRYWVQNVLPTVYDDSLSYYELLNKLVKYLNDVIMATNATIKEVNELETLYNELKSYVDNYFSSADFTEKIEEALDEMVEQGTLGPVVQEALENLVEEMDNRMDTIEEDYLKTVGGVSGVDNDVPIRELSKVLGQPGFYNVLDYGVYNDGVTDNMSAINTLAKLVKANGGGTIYFPSGRYIVSNNIFFGDNTVITGDGESSEIYMSRASNYSGLVIGLLGSNIELKNVKVDFADDDRIFTMSGNNMGAIGIGTGDIDLIEDYAEPDWGDVSVKNIKVHDIYSDASYVCQTESSSDTSTVTYVEYYNIKCKGVLSATPWFSYQITDMFIHDVDCMGIRMWQNYEYGYESKNIVISNVICDWFSITLTRVVANNITIRYASDRRAVAKTSGLYRVFYGKEIIANNIRIYAEKQASNPPSVIAETAGASILSNCIVETDETNGAFDLVFYVSNGRPIFSNVIAPNGSTNTLTSIDGYYNFNNYGNNYYLSKSSSVTFGANWGSLSNDYPNKVDKVGRIVHVSGAIYKASSGVTSGEEVIVLPEYYRPETIRYVQMNAYDSSNSYLEPIYASIGTDGKVKLITLFTGSRTNVARLIYDFVFMI